MDAVGAHEDVACDGRSIMEPCDDAGRPLLIVREGLAKVGVILQSRKEGLAQYASIDLTGDVSASLAVFEIEAEARQLARPVIEEHEGAGFAGAPGGRPNEVVIPLRQARPQGLASCVIDREAIALTADVASAVALEHRDGD